MFADILTRWVRGYRAERVQTKQISALIQIDQIVPSSADVDWPDMKSIELSQKEAKKCLKI